MSLARDEKIAAGAYRDDAPALASHPGQLAYVIYTSGSTGTPKGAMVTLAGMLNNQLGKIPYLGLTHRDVIAQTAAPSFDISIWQMLTGLYCGAVVEIIPDDVVADPRALLRHLRDTGVTVAQLVPAVIHELLHHDPVELPALRFLLPTGEALSPELARLWLRRYPNVPLINAYGPAECADDVALCRIDAPPPAGTARMPIGTPTDNTQLYVLDATLAPVPIGVVGQLAVAGVGVGHGYLADPARTARAFVPDPFDPFGPPGQRLYLTGDLARYRPDGVLEFVGRADLQVKLRGHRIELGEIEARLLEAPGVAAAAVVLRHDVPGQPRLVGYVVPSPAPRDGAPALPALPALPDALRARLAPALPEPMIPSQFVVLDALPLTANGKLDRSALSAPDSNEPSAPYIAPRTELEATLARIWADALGTDRVGIHDNFFELGGHSLLITRVAARIRHELGVELPLRAVFDGQTVAAVAALIERGQPRARSAEIAVMSDLLDELEQM
jgi:amino acid adenylation domain-containing protein